MGMGGAFVAQADDPSAIFYNPAGITQLKGLQAMVGISPIMPGSSFRSDGNATMGTAAGQVTRSEDHTWLIPHGYVTYRFNDKVSTGVGIFSRFGLGTEWPKTFEGRFTSGAERAFVKTFAISPVVAVQPVKGLSFGIGPYIQYFEVDLRNRVFLAAPTPPLTPDSNAARTAQSRLSGNNWAVGANIGMLYKVNDILSLGVSYLSSIRHNVRNGDQELIRLSDGALVRSLDARSTITLPSSVTMGAALRLKPWTFEVDLQWTEWSTYESLKIDLSNGTTKESPKKWRNVWALRTGVQYNVNQYLDLRAGFVWDQSPIPRDTLDPLVPSGDRRIYCGGVGIHYGKITLDLAYNYLQDQGGRWNNSAGDVMVGTTTMTRVRGNFKDTHAHILSMSIVYAFN